MYVLKSQFWKKKLELCQNKNERNPFYKEADELIGGILVVQ